MYHIYIYMCACVRALLCISDSSGWNITEVDHPPDNLQRCQKWMIPGVSAYSGCGWTWIECSLGCVL